jgi:hypothetical protein
MNNRHLLIPLLLGTALLGACSSESQSNLAESIKSDVAKNIDTEMTQAIEKAKSDLTDINIDLADGSKATIASNGDLVIAGTAVALTAEQRVLTTQYFNASKQIALQGLEIGKESAKLATQAIGSALSGVIKGENQADIEKKIDVKAGNIEAVAQKLCDSALQLKDLQQKLSASIPAFTPVPMEVDSTSDGCNVKDGVISAGGAADKALSEAELTK